MAESYSVKAVLSAVDKGFASTLKSATTATENLAKKLTSGFNFGFITGAGQAAFGALKNSVSGLVGEIDSSNAAWKTFAGNMGIIEANGGKLEKSVEEVKSELQDFAQQTVYSASDMAGTYAQLAAVGVKNTSKLVKGFGGLAAAAENPQQAMKTLSQQATQMAAKPYVAWADFKLMLEQTPAGMAAVANAMGMTSAELVTAIQNGWVATDDFLEKIAEVGTSDGFSKMATQPKTMGQAMDGLTETISNKLTPAWDVLSKAGIGAIEGLSSKLGGFDATSFADKISYALLVAEHFGKTFIRSFAGVKESVTNALSAVGEALGITKGSFTELDALELFRKACETVAGAITAVAGFIEQHSGTIAKFAPLFGKIALGVLGLKAANTVAPGLTKIVLGLGKLGAKGIVTLAAKLLGIAGGTKAVGTASEASAPSILKSAVATLALGAAVALAAIGLAVLVQSAITLASAGWPAVAALTGLVAVVALLAVGAAALGPALTAGAVGFIAFGGAIALVGVGAVLVAAALAIIASTLPALVEHGANAAVSIALLGASMAAFGAGVAYAGIGLAALSVGFAGAAVGVTAFGLAMAGATVGTAAMAVALLAVTAEMKSIAKNAKSAEKSLDSMRESVSVVESGLKLIGNIAENAMDKIKSVFNKAAKTADKSGTDIGTNFGIGLNTSLLLAMPIALMGVTIVNTTLASGKAGAYRSGFFLSQGFASGMLSQLGTIKAAANEMAAAADKAVQAKLKIHSPSKVGEKSGGFYGAGVENGIIAKAKDVWNAAEELFSIPQVATPRLAMAYAGEMNSDFEYYRNSDYTIEVPLTVDGREVARATATYTQEELDKRQMRDSRKHGKV